MDARKRKRIFKTSQFSSTKFPVLCLCLFIFTLLYRGFIYGPFRPTPIVPRLKIFSSSISKSVQDITTHRRVMRGGSSSGDSEKPVELRVENRVVFPDHVLVILSDKHKGTQFEQRIDCVYPKELKGDSMEGGSVTYPMSAEEYGDDRWIVKCPTPPANYTTVVGLRGHRDIYSMVGFEWVAGMRESNKTVQSWDMLAYDAFLEGEDTAVLFVKGLRLKSDRESDASCFRCHFKNWSSLDDVGLTSTAITAAQEVIRCPLPPPVKEELRNNEEFQVTVERIRLHQVIPSIARLVKKNVKENSNNGYKYELCACSMVRNQAGFIKEWIAYHAWLGVQRWFIYDNNSDDELKAVINELNGKNYNVTRHVWPWVKSQEAGFSHCVLRAREQCRWVGFFDVDEFYYIDPPKIGNVRPGALRVVVDNVTSTLPLVGEIRTDCHSFGPSGLKKSPEEGVTLGYTCRMKNTERHKSIVRPEAVNDTLLNQVHHFMLKKEFRTMTLPKGKFVINHYKYQVWDVFKSKFNRRVSTYVVDWKENRNEKSKDRAPGLGTEAIEPSDWHKRFCEVWDTRLRDFILANLGDLGTGFVPWNSVL